MAKLFVGMPVYNGEKFISNAIDSLRSQTFQDWELLISDDCSNDDTSNICKNYLEIDSRISYHRHESNIGMGNNFEFVLYRANSEYFMWAAADDEREESFMEVCIDRLKNNEEYGMAFSSLISIDSFGRIVRQYPKLYTLAGQSNFKTIYRYVKEPEISGKANLLYSVFRHKVCMTAWKQNPFNNSIWGSDMLFVLAALAQKGVFIDKRVLFKKRIVREADSLDTAVNKIEITNPQRHIFHLNGSIKYIRGNYSAVYNTPYRFLVLFVMILRLPVAIRNEGKNFIKGILRRIAWKLLNIVK